MVAKRVDKTVSILFSREVLMLFIRGSEDVSSVSFEIGRYPLSDGYPATFLYSWDLALDEEGIVVASGEGFANPMDAFLNGYFQIEERLRTRFPEAPISWSYITQQLTTG